MSFWRVLFTFICSFIIRYPPLSRLKDLSLGCLKDTGFSSLSPFACSSEVYTSLTLYYESLLLTDLYRFKHMRRVDSICSLVLDLSASLMELQPDWVFSDV